MSRDGERRFHRSPARHAIGDASNYVVRNNATLLVGKRECGGAVGHDCYDAGAESKSISCRDDSAQAATHSHGDVNGVELRNSAKQLHRIRAYPADQQWVKRWKPVPSAVNRNPVSDLGGGLKVMTLLDDFDAERSHRGIFLDAVPERYDNRRRDSVPASGKSHGLAVIPPRRGYHSVGFSAGAAKLFEIYETSTHLERTSWGVVLVFP